MKKDKLEDFISKNRLAFDSEEPGDDLWAKIDSSLPPASVKSTPSNLQWLWKAATIVGIIGTIYFAYRDSQTNNIQLAKSIENINIDKSLKPITQQISHNVILASKNETINKLQAASNEKNQVKSNQKELANPILIELSEINAYYTFLINQKQKEIFQFTGNNPQIAKEIQIEFSDLDKAMKELKNELKNNINNELIVEAMIQNYRIKLDILENILSQIKGKNNEDKNKEKQIITL